MNAHYRPLLPLPRPLLSLSRRCSKFVKPQLTCSFYLFDVLFRVHRAAAGASKPRRTIEKFFVPRIQDFRLKSPCAWARMPPLVSSSRLLSIFPRIVRRGAQFPEHIPRNYSNFQVEMHLNAEPRAYLYLSKHSNSFL